MLSSVPDSLIAMFCYFIVPTVGPNVTSGSYVDECVNGKRNVILYFKVCL